HGRLERAFPRGTIDVDVDPLIVAGAVRELVDALLIELDPSRDTDLMPHELVERAEAQGFARHVHATRADARTGPAPCRAPAAARFQAMRERAFRHRFA